MKTRIFLLGVVALLLLGSCSKEKACRCAIRSDQADPQKVRVIMVKQSVNCKNLNYVIYDESEIRQGWQDSPLVCTDYEFAIDSIFNEDK